MLNKTQYKWLLILALASLILVLVNIGIFFSNKGLSGTVSGRQQYLQQSDQLLGVYQTMISSLANLAAKNNDNQIHDLLASQGITYNVNPAPPATKK